MFDLGWSELLLLAVVAIVVVGPHDLPRLMRTVGQYATKARRMARDLQSQFDEAVRDADLEDVGKEIKDLTRMNPVRQVRDTLTKPLKSVGDELEKTAANMDKEAKADNVPAPAPAPQPSAVSETPLTESVAEPKPEPAAEIAETANAGPERAATGS